MKDSFPELEKRELPSPLSWKKALGVGVVVMGMAVGTGEIILWPHLVTKHGLNILWMALLGITSQYFINKEVARYTLATGESFFTASARVFKWLVPFWFFSAIILYIWPGWAAALGTILKELFNFGSYYFWSLIVLGLVLLITFLGRVAYNVLEKSLKIVVPTFILMLLVISFFNLNWSLLMEALRGLFSFGSFPKEIDINVLLGAIVFTGAGGMLNLCVSLWYRDKQLGMCAYGEKITNPISGKTTSSLTKGYIFETNPQNLEKWRGWMKYVKVDQGIIFWLTGLIALFLLVVNAYAVLKPQGIVPEGLQLAVVQAHIFGQKLGKFGFDLFLIMTFLMLFSVMWTVIDALTRIISDILYTNSRIGPFSRFLKFFSNIPLNFFYYGIIVLIVIAGALLIPLKQPLAFLVLSGALGGLSMAIYTPLLIYINNRLLPKEIRPDWKTNLVMTIISIFYIIFSLRIIESYF
ncbi:MAG: iron transporter [Candidatus Parcubacteria bacterium]|nr:Nramp family divalent metal transporter [Patescibacteria group bacterium]BCX16060.1 MAG: iron transporter [Candidatus Parcubacteria bacterium]